MMDRNVLKLRRICGFGRSLEKRPVQYPPLRGRPRIALDGRLGGGSQLMPVGSLQSLPTGRLRRGLTGQSSPGIPAKGRGMREHPADRGTLTAAQVLGTPLPLVRTEPRRDNSKRHEFKSWRGRDHRRVIPNSSGHGGRGWRPPDRAAGCQYRIDGLRPEDRMSKGSVTSMPPGTWPVPGTGRRSPEWYSLGGEEV